MRKREGKEFSEFSGVVPFMVHEIRTSLQIAKGYIDLCKGGDMKYKYCEIIVQEVERMDLMLQNLMLMYSNQDYCHDHAKEFLFVTPIIKAQFSAYNEIFGKDFDTDFLASKEDLKIYGNARLLEEMTRSLLENAFKYSPAGAKVRVSVRQDNDWIILSFKNTGVGVDANRLNEMFNPCISCTRTEMGFGIGSKLVRKIVELHKGELRLESNNESYVEVFVMLPLTC